MVSRSVRLDMVELVVVVCKLGNKAGSGVLVQPIPVFFFCRFVGSFLVIICTFCST